MVLKMFSLSAWQIMVILRHRFFTKISSGVSGHGQEKDSPEVNLGVWL